MLIKIKDNEILEQHLDDLKRLTNSCSATKAVAIAASNYPSHLVKIAKQSKKIDELETKLNYLFSLLSNKFEVQNDINQFIKENFDINKKYE